MNRHRHNVMICAMYLMVLFARQVAAQSSINNVAPPPPGGPVQFWIDADPSTAGMQAARVVPVGVGGTFSVDVIVYNVPALPQPLRYAHFWIHYDQAVVNLTGAVGPWLADPLAVGVCNPPGSLPPFITCGTTSIPNASRIVMENLPYCCPCPSVGPGPSGTVTLARLVFTVKSLGQTGLEIGPGFLPPPAQNTTVVYRYGSPTPCDEPVPIPSDPLTFLTRGKARIVVDPTGMLSCLNVNRTTDLSAVPATLAFNSPDSVAMPLGRDEVTLRSAIQLANQLPGPNRITFRIPTTGPPWTIAVGSGVLDGLPALSDPAGVQIDGMTQPGIEVNGIQAGNDDGLLITSANNTIRRLMINDFAGGAGVRITGAGASGNTIQGCTIGMLEDVQSAAPNGTGVLIMNAPNNLIGSPDNPLDFNHITGNTGAGIMIAGAGATDNRVQTNLIGLVAGGNGSHGIWLAGAERTVIGGTTQAGPGAPPGNVISLNGGHGVHINSASNNTVQGNIIGLNPAGDLVRRNIADGIAILSGDNNLIGGPTPAERNIISGNDGNGVSIFSGGPPVAGNRVQGNYIGTTLNGAGGPGNLLDGVNLSGVTGLTLGGIVDPAAGPGSPPGNVISGNRGHGIQIMGPNPAGGVTVQGNLIGLNAAGTAALRNSLNGVLILVGNNRIGGAPSGARNVISGNTLCGIEVMGGNAVENAIESNWIGLALDGTTPAGNGEAGVFINAAPNNTIGGAGAALRNVISANGTVSDPDPGILISGAAAIGNRVQANYIGTNADGQQTAFAQGNSAPGVLILNAVDNLVGGAASAPGQPPGNVITGNDSGVFVTAAGATGNRIQGNIIGLDADGQNPVSTSNLAGVVIAAATNNTIGGTSQQLRNVISQNNGVGVALTSAASDNRVENNHIGVDAAGTRREGNTNEGVLILNSSNNLVGSPGAGNVISANGTFGVTIVSVGATSTGNRILANRIGTDAAGMAGVRNNSGGVLILSSSSGSSANQVGESDGGNLISGNSNDNVLLTGVGTDNNRVEYNIIGPDVLRNQSLAPQFLPPVVPPAAPGLSGVHITGFASNNLIRQNDILLNGSHGVLIEAPAPANEVSNNFIRSNPSFGLEIRGATGNVVADNTIDLNANSGVFVSQGAAANFIGFEQRGNDISGNGADGVTILGAPANFVIENTIHSNDDHGVRVSSAGIGIRRNSMAENDLLGIELVDAANNSQSAPVLSSAAVGPAGATISGSLTSAPGTYTVEFFANAACDPSGHGEGRTYLGSTTVTIGPSGSAAFSASLSGSFNSAAYVTATATDAVSNTSEFSACFTIGPVEGCGNNAECADMAGPGFAPDELRDDNCLWWECDAGSCISTNVVFADVGGEAGSCRPDGSADANDKFHALNCFSDTNFDSPGEYQCEPFGPVYVYNVDAGGAGLNCCPDGECDANDAFAALNAFSGTSLCAICPQDSAICVGGGKAGTPCGNDEACAGGACVIQNPTSHPCAPPTATAPFVPRIVENAIVSATASQRTAKPGDLVQVRVFMENSVNELRGYQLHMGVSGGKTGTLKLVDVSIENRADHVFANLAHWDAFNTETEQMLAGLDGQGVPTAAKTYLATYTYRVSPYASGTFVVDVLGHSQDQSNQRTFLFGSDDGMIGLSGTRPAAIVVTPGRSVGLR